MQRGFLSKYIRPFLAWMIALALFFPIIWMILASFKPETLAIASPPKLIFEPTLKNYQDVLERANYLHFFTNSLIQAILGTFVSLLIGIPAAYAMAFYAKKHTKDVLMWMLSTKMMPAVGVLMPIYLISKNAGLLDTHTGLIIIFTLMNLPIVIWLLYIFFRDIPKDLIEAALMDGAKPFRQFIHVLLPITLPGLASTALLCIIFIWNEAFWSINLSVTKAAPLTAFIASFSSPQGLFWAKLSAASVLAVAPILMLGWAAQKQLVRGLTLGAVK